MRKTILITGGCGFIGHHFVEHILVNTDWDIIIFDKLTYASYGLERLRDTGALNSPRVKLFTYDLSHPISVGLRRELNNYNVRLNYSQGYRIPSLKEMYYKKPDHIFPIYGDSTLKPSLSNFCDNRFPSSISATFSLFLNIYIELFNILMNILHILKLRIYIYKFANEISKKRKRQEFNK